MKSRDDFDATDPAEQISDELRKKVADMVAALQPDKRYEGLEPHVRVQALIGGIMTGLVGVCFAHIEEAGYDAIMEYIEEYLPHARAQAEGIMANQPH